MSLLEILVALTLSSLILILLSQNLSMLALDSLHFKQSTESEHSALLALLLLQNQIQSSRETECTPSATPAFEIINTATEYGLNIDTLADTLYIANAETAHKTQLSHQWHAADNPVLVVDDCISATSTDISTAQNLVNTATHFPVSVSLKTSHQYRFQNKQLVLKTPGVRHDVLFDHIQNLQIQELPDHRLKIEITPENANAPFSLHITPGF